ncbi:toxin transporter [Haloterrigena salinisoli]|uniref:toxin transporter n=1 Tax=Haloterrigena salinisoli TaxID=3132747 RepID=UPI0030D06CD1
MLLAIALACSFVFAGGVAAADDTNSGDDGADSSDLLEQDINQDADLNQYAEAELEQEQYVSQSNVGVQGGNAAYADDGGSATASNSLDQTNQNAQIGDVEAENEGEIDQEAENEFEVDFSF